MSIRIALSHETTYRFAEPVELTPHVVRLRPAPHCRTPILSYSLKVDPKEHFLNWQQDPYGNHLGRLVFVKPAQVLTVRVDLIADMTVINPFDFFLEESVETFPFEYSATLKQELAPYLQCDPVEPPLARLIEEVRTEGARTIDYLVAVNQTLQSKVGYVIRLEPGVQTPTQTLESGKGSCRDSAWLGVQLLRNLGLAARFVSGYLIQLVADQKALDGPSGPTQDFTDLHAWTEVFIPGAGWIGIDPTSGLLTGEGHIPLAASARPSSAAAISGSFLWTPPSQGATLEQSFDFKMEVSRVRETPRVTLPYTPAQWESINSLGCRVDEELLKSDVRLTMGGEPTFVSLDDMDGEEWNTGALGANKKRLAGELLLRLKDKFSKGGVVQYGQGKQYPGEAMPRWSMTCLWRKDGLSLWRLPHLLADPATPGRSTPSDGKRFLEALVQELGLSGDFVRRGYEDRFYYIWREGRLPVNVDVLQSKVDWKEEREQIRRVFDRGLDTLVGYLLPLQAKEGGGFATGRWPLRREQVFLIPGDSPMGYRLPIDSLPWVSDADRALPYERDPMDAPPPQFQTYWDPPSQANEPTPSSDPEVGESSPGYVRTALCIEVRDGHIHIFLPPLERGEPFVELLNAIESVAERESLPIVLEGYGPPYDPRISSFSVTPDPGVIEVNVQPSESWNDLVQVTETLYQEARLCRLGAEKFMIDGRHTGTGGGNHLVLGAKTPAESPFLRRPDLLASMVCYWINHPSLSYLFSGLFVGPTSQAPRLDEARHDSLYELEIALEHLPTVDQPQLWLVDRLFRHLLTDLTGNTHRAEFCIDKLYSPDGPTGRLGLLELRAFEMPPHSQMSLAVQLLVRALVARFWRQPYREKPIRWGTRLHDQFLLGHFVWKDLLEVLKDLDQSGFSFDAAWFRPHYEFRFPQLGEIHKDGLSLELRTAIEPWHVLGEEQGGGGTARFVDSSLERVQVKTKGFVNGRHRLLCNGETVPLHETGVPGEAVAGVRFRAWQPPSCLHPTIGVHTPLRFDIVDNWSQRSLGGCQYDVSHPGGRSYETFPVNANEAQARRSARFTELSHTGGTIEVDAAHVSTEFPLTLDLRRHQSE